MHTCMHAYIHPYVYIHTYIYIYVFIYLHVVYNSNYITIYIYAIWWNMSCFTWKDETRLSPWGEEWHGWHGAQTVPPPWTGRLSDPVRHQWPSDAWAQIIWSYHTLWWTNIAMENHHAINGKSHYQSPFSIAMLNYQRVSIFAIAMYAWCMHNVRLSVLFDSWMQFFLIFNLTQLIYSTSTLFMQYGSP